MLSKSALFSDGRGDVDIVVLVNSGTTVSISTRDTSGQAPSRHLTLVPELVRADLKSTDQGFVRMAFRAGVHSARGAVYTRRRGRRGVRAARMRVTGLIGGPETIYEENDEESDCPVAGNSQLLISQAKAPSSRNILFLKWH